MEPLVKTNTYERGSYHCFDPSIFETVRKVSFCEYTLSMMLVNSASYSPINILFLASNVEPPCRIILFYIMKCWKRDHICLNFEEETKTFYCKVSIMDLMSWSHFAALEFFNLAFLPIWSL